MGHVAKEAQVLNVYLRFRGAAYMPKSEKQKLKAL